MSNQAQRAETFKLRNKAALVSLRTGAFYSALFNCAVTWKSIAAHPAEFQYIQRIALFALEQIRVIRKNVAAAKKKREYVRVVTKDDADRYSSIMSDLDNTFNRVAAITAQTLPR